MCACWQHPSGLGARLPPPQAGEEYAVVELRHRDESEATELLTASFALTPEPLMDWLCGPEHPLERDATGTATSTSVGNKKRLEIVRGLMRWSFVTCLLYGRCFGVRGRDSKLLGVAACMPPGAVKKGVVLTSWRWLRVLLRAGAPEIFRSKDRFGPLPGARCEVMGEAVDGLHKACAPGPHWYVFTLGVAHGTQSRGVGTALLSVIANLAVADKCPVYLEAAGDNANYYRSRGFRVVKSATLRAPPSLPTGAVAKAAAAAEEQAEWQREGAELGGALRGHAMLLEGPVVLSKVARDMPVLSAIRKSRDQRR